MMTMEAIPRTSFRLPFGLGFQEQLRVDAYDSENIVIGRTSSVAAPSAIYLGKLAEFEQMRRNVWLDCVGAHAIYVMGKRRSGKSYTLGAICEGLASPTWLRIGPPDQAVLLLDTLNIYGTLHVPVPAGAVRPEQRAWQIPMGAPVVRYVAPQVTQESLAAPSTRLSLDPAWLTLEDWCSFFDVDPFADPLGHLLSVVHDAVQPIWGGGPVPGEVTGIETLCRILDTDPNTQTFPNATREALRRRLLAVERFGVFARPSPSIDTLLVAGAITVCQLRDLDDRLRALVVAVLIREVMRARARADAAVRRQAAEAAQRGEQVVDPEAGGMPRCWVVIDEAHNYLPSTGSLPSRQILRRLITEGRNIGLSVVVATQQPSGLDGSIQRNADALIVHSMSMRDDIAAAEGMLNTLVPETAVLGASERMSGRTFEKLVRRLPQGYAVVSTDTSNRILGLCVRPRQTVHGGEAY
jgi:hypothetical protein